MWKSDEENWILLWEWELPHNCLYNFFWLVSTRWGAFVSWDDLFLLRLTPFRPACLFAYYGSCKQHFFPSLLIFCIPRRLDFSHILVSALFVCEKIHERVSFGADRDVEEGEVRRRRKRGKFIHLSFSFYLLLFGLEWRVENFREEMFSFLLFYH